ncbi:MAG TPA: FtsX-like permease family protein, partial [Propionicimonas sp.]
QRAVQAVAVDWQVQVQPGAAPGDVMAAIAKDPGNTAALPVSFAQVAGFSASSGGSSQTTGSGVVLGLPDGYQTNFPGQIRMLSGSDGVLIAQQTASNLHVGLGDTVTINRSGTPATVVVTGVVDLPQADSLFQRVGAAPQSQPVAPPDNVILLPASEFARVMSGGSDPTTTQIHVHRSAPLPSDPAEAYQAVVGAAHNLEAATSGAALVGNNLGAAIDAARSDAAYAQMLFLFLGLPGALLAGVLTMALAGAGATRRRQEQALLRTRGFQSRQVLGLAALEAGVVGVAGAVAGIAMAAVAVWAALGLPGIPLTGGTTAVWFAAAAALGVVIAAATVLTPVIRDLRLHSIAQASQVVGRQGKPWWMRTGLDFVVLAGAGIIYWASSGNNYSLVLAPEGVPTISVSYWAFLGPTLLWIGGSLLLWRLTTVALTSGRATLARMLTPLTGRLSTLTAASLARQHRPIARAVVLLAMAISFAISTSVFNATYQQQAEADAQLTNGADVTVTISPGTVTTDAMAQQIAATPAVTGVEPLLHRYAYVGADLQDLYGVHPGTIGNITALQDAYFQGGTAKQLMSILAGQPDAILVSSETVVDYQLKVGDLLNLRIQDGRTKQLITVPFHYVGIALEFPTAPHDSFFIANSDYVAQQTGTGAVGSYLVDTSGTNQKQVAAALQTQLGDAATITDIEQVRNHVGSSLTSVNLTGLTRLELGFAILLAAGAGGMALALSMAERRRSHAILAVLGATPRQRRATVLAEALVVLVGGLVGGVAVGSALSVMLVQVLTGGFDPPPSTIAVPWAYLAGMTVCVVVSLVAGALLSSRLTTRPPVEELREA